MFFKLFALFAVVAAALAAPGPAPAPAAKADPQYLASYPAVSVGYPGYSAYAPVAYAAPYAAAPAVPVAYSGYYVR